MKRRHKALLSILAALCMFAALGASHAIAAPVWNLDLHHNQTNFPSGGTGQYWVEVNNVGETESSGEITVTVQLPPGLTLAAQMETSFPDLTISWSCTGTTTVVCKTSGTIPRHHLSRNLILQVAVEPSIPEGTVLTAVATLEGGGAAKATSTAEPTTISSSAPGFGILDGSFSTDFLEADSLTPVRKAGSHPPLLVTSLDFNSVPTTLANGKGVPIKQEDESLRDLHVTLPPGFLGNPTAVGECTQAQFTVKQCPPSSQVGRFDASVYPFTGAFTVFNFSTGIFNLTHPRGAITDLAFVINGNPVHIKASLDPKHDYAITTTVPNVNETLPPFNSRATFWGVPAESNHDSERCSQFSGPGNGGDTSGLCATDHEKKPFLTLPDRCSGDNEMRLSEYDSWQNPGVFGPDITYSLPGQFTECEAPRFEPQVSLEPTGSQASTPTGLDVQIHVPQNENPNAVATPPVKSTTVTLPEGMTVNPSFADGLQGCSEAQIGLGTDNPVNCPDNSRIGEVSLSTPLLPKPIEGSMYLAKQKDNPFGSLLALYLAVHDTEERGVLVKVPGEISLDPITGQITTTFDDLPQFPFEDLTLKFRSGPRAPLVNPPTCGSHEIEAQMTSYARPDEKVNISSSYSLSEGPEGSACHSSLSARPFAPKLSGGTENPLAGAFSPLNLRVSRTDADQELSSFEGFAPPGLVASLRGVGRCSDAQIQAAMARKEPGEGALEVASPSCPSSSQIGTIQAGAGSGPNPIYVPGKLYLAGPYKGAPLSGVAIVPAIAGPVDLGNVVVRAPAYVNPRTARIRIASDPLPQVIDGVLIRTRDVRVSLDRPGFALNPTSCEPMAIEASFKSAEGASANASQRFQVGSCAGLGFKPSLSLKLKGGTKRGGHPALRGTYRPRAGDANLEELVLRLPRSAFLDQGHIRTICTRVQFAARACPQGAIYGHATAWTPLLDQPLEGPVYLRSSNHNLPDFVADLNGTIEVEAVARIDSVKGGIRASFEDVPDAPLEKVVVDMQGAKKGLIVNSTDLCAAAHKANVQMTGQSGKAFDSKPLVQAAGCKGRG
jgi:uncharacterized repeat protein (TIGR01451 family)